MRQNLAPLTVLRTQLGRLELSLLLTKLQMLIIVDYSSEIFDKLIFGALKLSQASAIYLFVVHKY